MFCDIMEHWEASVTMHLVLVHTALQKAARNYSCFFLLLTCILFLHENGIPYSFCSCSFFVDHAHRVLFFCSTIKRLECVCVLWISWKWDQIFLIEWLQKRTVKQLGEWKQIKTIKKQNITSGKNWTKNPGRKTMTNSKCNMIALAYKETYC